MLLVKMLTPCWSGMALPHHSIALLGAVMCLSSLGQVFRIKGGLILLWDISCYPLAEKDWLWILGSEAQVLQTPCVCCGFFIPASL